MRIMRMMIARHDGEFNDWYLWHWPIRSGDGLRGVPMALREGHVMVMAVVVDPRWPGLWGSSYLPFPVGVSPHFDNYCAILVHIIRRWRSGEGKYSSYCWGEDEAKVSNLWVTSEYSPFGHYFQH